MSQSGFVPCTLIEWGRSVETEEKPRRAAQTSFAGYHSMAFISLVIVPYMSTSFWLGVATFVSTQLASCPWVFSVTAFGGSPIH